VPAPRAPRSYYGAASRDCQFGITDEMKPDAVRLFMIGELSIHRSAKHGFQIGEVVALRADSTARRVVPTDHVATGFLARGEIEANFHRRKLFPKPPQFRL
jgi:hypothetical protein